MNQNPLDRERGWAEPQRPPEPESQLQAWGDWLRSMAALGASFSQLLSAEAKLALGDLRRLLLLVLLALPILCLAWIGLSVLLAWWMFEATASVAGGLSTFFGLQLFTLFIMGAAARRYQRSLGLPRTREHLATIIRDFEHATQSSASADTRD